MKSFLPTLRSVALAAVLVPAALWAQVQAPQPPEIAARNYLLLDITAGQVLAAKDIDAPVEQASLTKLMTGYLVFDALRAKKIAPTGVPRATLGRRLASNGEVYDAVKRTYTPGPGFNALAAGLISEALVDAGNVTQNGALA